ncbi:MAG: hypothetical protein E7660_00365 [Ruminococcaceae bacterium]|nr:hypothetical protein [Oscillospiraceae bacterium]
MKKIIAALMCILMLLSAITMTGCEIGKKNEEAPDGGTKTDVEATKVVMNTENFSITFAELNYMFIDEFNALINNVYNMYQDSYVSVLQQMYGLDVNKSLKEQMMTDNSGSYFSYFLESAKLKAADILMFCEVAKEQGFELTEDDRAALEADVASYTQMATQNNATISDLVGDKMGLTNEEVLKSYLEKNYLAKKAYDFMVNSYEHTEDEIEKEFLASPKEYAYVNFLAYTMQKDDNVSAEAVKTAADALAACTDPESFKTAAEDFHNNVLYAGKEDYPSFSATNLEKKNVSYQEGTEYLDWMFGEEASVNGTFVSSDETNGIYTVYMLLKMPSENAYYKKNVRHILFLAESYSSTEECKKAAEEIYDMYKKNPTEEKFTELAKEYTEDPGSKENGGLYENVGYNEMVADFENWIFEEGRTAGDTGIILTSYGYHIMYFVGDGDHVTPGHDKALNALKSIDYAADHKEMEEKYTITTDDAYLQNIDA